VSASSPPPLVIAHRGASALEYENSLAAFRAAARLGADGVELDVHATTDGELFVHHDEALDGGGLHIPRASAALVGAQRLPNGEPVPTLADALAAIAPPLRVFVEVKTLPPSCDAHLLQVLERGAPGRYAVHGFDHRIIRRLGEARGNLPRGILLASYPIRPLQALADTGATMLWEDYALIDADLVEEIHGSRARLFAWTVDDSVDMQRLADLGVDALCTNHPDVARRVVGPSPRGAAA